MTTGFLSQSPLFNYRGAKVPNGSQAIVLLLLVIGIVASFISLGTLQLAIKQSIKPNELFSYTGDITKPAIYYAAYAVQIATLLTAGLIALCVTDFRLVESGYFLKFMLLIGAALLMTARSYTLSDLLSTKLVDQHGPLPFVMCVLVFVGARRSYWTFLDRLIIGIAVVISFMTVLEMAGLRSFTRHEGVVSLAETLDALYWPAAWTLLRRYPRSSLATSLKLFPIMIYSLGSFFTQTRLDFVMIFSLLAVYTLLQRKRRIPQAPAWVIAAVFVVGAFFFAYIFLRDTRAFERIDAVAAGFQSRFDEDTRTGQLIAFAQDVSPQELLLGKGSFGTWQWGNVLWGGADLGYLTLLFYGGVPLFVTYVMAYLRPGIAVLKRNPTDLQLTAAGVVSLWCVKMCSSAYPSVSLGDFAISCCVGACISRDRWGQTDPL